MMDVNTSEEKMTDLYCTDGSQHEEGKGKWYRRYFCGQEVRPQYRVHCKKCNADITNFMTVKGLGVYQKA